MAFQSTIDNDTVASLPAARFAGRIVVVDSAAKIEAACNDLKRYTTIGFDTETRPSFRAGVSYKVALLQLSTPTTCYFHADGFVDLQAEAPHWGIEEKSLRKLSAIVLGQRVSKAQRLSNWEAESLTEQQREYAATDAWVCIEILETLQRLEPRSEPLHIISVAPQPVAPQPQHKHPHRRYRRAHHSNEE